MAVAVGTTIDGGGGSDTVVLHGKRSEYTLVSYNGQLAVGDRVSNRDGLQILTNVEQLTFQGDNRTLALGSCGITTAQQYINGWPDLVNAFGTDAAAGFNHYLNNGYAEKAGERRAEIRCL